MTTTAPANSKYFGSRTAWTGYAIAVFSSVLAILVKLWLDRYIGFEAPFLLLYTAVFVSAYYGGRAPGLLATLLTGMAVDWYFLRPSGTLSLDTPNLIRVAVYLVECLAVTLICSSHRKSQDAYRRLNEYLQRKETKPVTLTDTVHKAEQAADLTRDHAVQAAIDAAMPYGIAIIDSQCRQIFVNRAFAETLGFDNPAVMIEQSMFEFVAPEDRKRLAERGSQSTPGDAAPELFTFKAQCKDGTIRDIETYLSDYVLEGQRYTLLAARHAADAIKSVNPEGSPG